MASTVLESLRYITLDVFTTTRHSGNPLALVLLQSGQDVKTAQMQAIAREFNYSETVFLYDQEDKTEDLLPSWRFRIFTIDAELTFAGHPTIGTAAYLLTLSASSKRNHMSRARLLCNAGPIDLGLNEDSSVEALIPHNFHQHVNIYNNQGVLDIQPSLRSDQIKSINLVSPVNGMTFLVVELTDLKALASIAITGKRPNLMLDEGWNTGFAATAFYVSTGPTNGTHEYRTRMIEQTFEDPATGSMSCGLAMYLTIRAGIGRADYQFTQGVEMGRKSDIGVSVILKNDYSTVESVTLRGSAVQVMEGVVLV